MEKKSESCSVVSDSLQPHGLYSPWNSPGQNTGVGSLLQGIFPTQGSNPGVPHCRQILYQLSHQGSPRILEWAAYPFSSRSSRPRNWTGVSCISGGFFTSWATREAQCGRPGFGPWVGKILREGIGYPLQYSGPENSMDCMYSPWGCKESGTTTWTPSLLFAWFSRCH